MTTPTAAQLARLDDATRTLAEVSTAAQAWELSRTAEAARRYAQLRGLGTDAVNYATGIKAKALILLADFVDQGQSQGTVRKAGGPIVPAGNNGRVTLPELLDTTSAAARKAVHEARRTRAALRGVDIDGLVAQANAAGEDLGVAGLRMKAAAGRNPEPVADPIPAAPGTYRCIVIDPPWPMRKIERRERPAQGVALDYPVLTLEQIADEATVPVRAHADDDAHLYLWVTHRFLPAGLRLLEAWGFRYQCVMTWRKNVGITPFSWMYDTEHVLFASRGNLPLEKLGQRLSFAAPAVGHSIKPDVFYERVTAASPGPRIEMFARRQRDGFEVWGNEVSSNVD
ncbi:MAG: MT-A70 family methyltransferase [Pseudonocardiaceae bacterium]